jgi:hypothetical protein
VTISRLLCRIDVVHYATVFIRVGWCMFGVNMCLGQPVALSLGTYGCRKQTVLLLSERARREIEKLVSPVTKECTQINILTRR